MFSETKASFSRRHSSKLSEAKTTVQRHVKTQIKIYKDPFKRRPARTAVREKGGAKVKERSLS